MKLSPSQKHALDLGRRCGGIVPISGKGWWPLFNGLRKLGLVDASRAITDRGLDALATIDAERDHFNFLAQRDRERLRAALRVSA